MGCKNRASLEYTMSIIGGKWTLVLIYLLSVHNILRYGELKKLMPKITHKMLSSRLKEMEKEKIILRKEYPQIPPKVEYSLTDKGRSLIPVLNTLCKWGLNNNGKP